MLQNTLEQVLLAVGAHLALATTLRGEELVLLPVLVGVFLLGRITFAVGYGRGLTGRAFGMALTLVPTYAAYAIALVLIGLGR